MTQAEKIKLLEDKVAKLEQKLQGNQLKHPLDITSKNIVRDNVPVYISFTAGSPTVNGSILVKINERSFKLMTTA